MARDVARPVNTGQLGRNLYRDSPEEELSGNIDDLQRTADEARQAILGADYFARIRAWYNFDPPGYRRVAYHPLVRVADLQMMNLTEAWELCAPHPKFFIASKNGRDLQREKAFNAAWKHLSYQLELLYSQVWAGCTGTGVLQVYYDPDYDSGLGAVRLMARDPESYYPDPAAKRDEDRAYVILEDYMTVEEISLRYGRDAARKVSLDIEGSASSGKIPRTFLDFPASSASLPPGPMRTLGPLGGGAFTAGDGGRRVSRIRVRSLFIKDSTQLPFTEELGLYLINEQQIIPEPDNIPAFPTGRLVVEAQRRVLFDGANPYRGFPVFRVPALPALTSYWAPPPTRFTQDLQDLAEDMYSQVYENAYRMNNVMMFVQRISGLTSSDITGLPGTVYFTEAAAGEHPVQVVVPPAFPPHFQEYPDKLLLKQRELRGQMPARQGQGSAGNVGMGLFDAQVYQSQGLTRLRSALFADVIQRVSEFVFGTMVDLADTAERGFPLVSGSDMTSAVWHFDPDMAEQDYKVTLDSASMRIDSATSLRNLGMALARFNLIDRESLLEWLDAPDPERLVQKLMQQEERAAMLAAVSGQQPGGKGKPKK